MGVTIIRTSDRQYFKRCRQEWDWTSKIRQNWEPLQRYPAFDFGTAIHKGLEAYYDPETWGDLKSMRRNAREAFRLSYAQLSETVKLGDLEFELNFSEAVDLGLRMLDYYFLWSPKQDEGFTPIYTEIEFEVPILGLEDLAVYQGRIDAIFEDTQGRYWIVDHKTAKQFGSTEWLALDDQCSSYAWAIKKQLGLDVSGVIYNQLRKKPPDPPTMLKSGGFSKNKQQDTTFELYLQELRKYNIDPHYYRDFLLFLKRNPKEFCKRTMVSYTDRTLAIVEQRIQKEARAMTSNPEIYPSPSPMNCNGCRFFRPCLALMEGADPGPILETNYVRRSV